MTAIGTSAAFIYSIFGMYKILTGDNSYAMHLYFEAAVTILTLITLGKYLEAISKGKTSEAIKKLMGLVPKTATIIRMKSLRGFLLIYIFKFSFAEFIIF